jgi:phenylpropionate dioxygenase-like ring-hydroxylating dioxygenase large terminal subunit
MSVDSLLVETIKQRAAREKQRAQYPEGFPPLPLIPTGRYTDPHFFALERERVFGTSWMFVAHTSELPTAGATLVLDQFPAPVFLVRDRDQQIRCFHNTCLHRGAPLVRAGEPPVKGSLACKYHGWVYRLDGQLSAIPDEHDFHGVDKSCLRLRTVRCESWANMVFINLDPHAPALRDALAPIVHTLDDEIGEQAAGQSYLLKKASIEVPANWKLTIEAQIEAYHVNVLHQKTAARFLDQREMSSILLQGGHSYQFVAHRAGVEFRFPALYFPRVNDLAKQGALAFSTFPNLVTVNGPNVIAAMTSWPLSPDTTRYDMHFIAAAPPTDSEREALNRQIELNLAIFNEDLNTLPSMQRSMVAGVIDTVRFGSQECRLYHLHEEIDRRIGVELIAAPLRVPQVLGAWVES